MFKRAVDIAVSAVLLVVALPLVLVAALMIRLTSPGPALFRQIRMGRGFQTFEILKLRTMAHAEAGLAYTLGPDPRITPVGKWLRRTKFDELPQLWNVLRGDMSLVGPRPVLPELTWEFRDSYAILLRVRPGLTDPASLKYSQEARLLALANDPMGFFKTVVTPDKIQISIEYMERANFWTDSGVLMQTALICCIPWISRKWMARRYGELPVVPVMLRSLGSHQKSATFRTPHPVDESNFSRDLAYLEATVEAVPLADDLAWIALQKQSPGSGSASQTMEGSASHL